MKKALLFVLIMGVMAVIGHVATVQSVPKIIMDKTLTTLQDRGIGFHQFFLSPRSSPQTQKVVRPSPDLAYSICLYDLTQTSTLIVQAGPWDTVGSVSFFDNHTNNYATLKLKNNANTQVILYPKNSKMVSDTDNITGAKHITSPTQRGIILIRRLAPRDADFARVAVLAQTDQCRAEIFP